MIKLSRASCGWFCALAFSAANFIAAQAGAETLTERLVADAQDGQLESFDFLSAALVASGVEGDEELSDWLGDYHQRRAELIEIVLYTPLEQRPELVHHLLHSVVLTGDCRVTASDLRRTLAAGDFNCLSSLALFWDLAQATHLPLEICLAQGHVFLHLAAGNEPMAIEPGDPRWEPGSAAGRSVTRRLTPVELLGKFYYNRGIDALRSGQFATGLERLRTSLSLDPADDDARANLVAGMNNWAVHHCLARRYSEAAMLIETGLRLDPAFAPLLANQRLVRARLGQ